MSDSAETIPFRKRFGCTVKEACSASGLKPTKLYELIGTGALKTMTVGRRRIILVESLMELIEGGATTEFEPALCGAQLQGPAAGFRKSNILYCSFCGKSEHEVRKLVAGTTAFICDGCVMMCLEVMLDGKLKPVESLPTVSRETP